MVEVILICLGVAVGIGVATRIDSEPKRPAGTPASARTPSEPAREPRG